MQAAASGTRGRAEMRGSRKLREEQWQRRGSYICTRVGGRSGEVPVVGLREEQRQGCRRQGGLVVRREGGRIGVEVDNA